MNDNYDCGIYRIKNIANGKCYIGSSSCTKRRKQNHFIDLRNNTHHSIKLQRAFNKYGENIFIFELLVYCEERMLINYEQQFLDFYSPEYNMSKVAGRVEITDELKTLRSKINKGKPCRPETRAKLRAINIGRKATDKTKEKMSLTRRGRATGRKGPWTEESKAKGRATRKANGWVPWNKGIAPSAATREKIRVKGLAAHERKRTKKRWILDAITL